MPECSDVYREAFEWVMLGRPVTLDGLASAMPILTGMGIGPIKGRGDMIELPGGRRVDVLPVECHNPPVIVTPL